MPQLQLYDNEEQKLYSLVVTEEEFDKIDAGDLALASLLLDKEKEKRNFFAAFNIMRESDNPITGTTKGTTEGPSFEESIQILDENDEISSPMSSTETDQGNIKMWNTNNTKFLIRLCQKYDKDFEGGVKKYVWAKIAKELTIQFKQHFTAQQCDTKFKVLKNMYKQIKKHNEKSGNNKKKWEYYEFMDEIMFTKPEITARATCSSEMGLLVNGTITPDATSGEEGTLDDHEAKDTPTSHSFVSNFTTKRKRSENKADKRHKEKMQRQDRYLDLLERLTNAVEKTANNDKN